jgi:hypothetical protein
MIAHVILFAPKADLSDGTREELLSGLAAAAASIPSIRRFRVGARVTHGLPGYEQLMREPYAFAVIIEFDDVAGLKAYLEHPAHKGLGAHFTTSASHSLAYDYELIEIPTGRQEPGRSLR